MDEFQKKLLEKMRSLVDFEWKQNQKDSPSAVVSPTTKVTTLNELRSQTSNELWKWDQSASRSALKIKKKDHTIASSGAPKIEEETAEVLRLIPPVHRR